MYYVRNWCFEIFDYSKLKLFYIFVIGGVGIGKSYFIKSIENVVNEIL